MTNIFVGFHDQRNSSRVLKPPGGGTSDIFGTDALKAQKNTNIENVLETAQEKSDLNVPTNEVPEGDQNTSNEKSENIDGEEKAKEDENGDKLSSEELKIESLNINEEKSDNIRAREGTPNEQTESKTEPEANRTTDTINSIITQKDKPATEPERRSINRVPPGGYSSGLW